MKKLLAALTALLTFCLVGPATAAGASNASLSADGRMTMVAPSGVRSAGKIEHEGLNLIYSTFNSDESNLYSCCVGWTISSVGSVIGSKQSIAMPFTPAADTNLRKVVVAMEWVTGLNEVVVSLHEDAGGMPGDTVKRAHVADLHAAGTCCEVNAIPSKPIPLTGGVQYWIVAKATADTWAAWNLNTINAVGTFAYNTGSGWTLGTDSLGAFAVYGD